MLQWESFVKAKLSLTNLASQYYFTFGRVSEGFPQSILRVYDLKVKTVLQLRKHQPLL